MSIIRRDVVLASVAFLAFPVAVNLTAVAASDQGPTIEDPLFRRGGGHGATSARR